MTRIIMSLWLLASGALWAQPKTQTIRGKVWDEITQRPLVGAMVYVEGNEARLGSITNEAGAYRIPHVPVGRQVIICKYPGYRTYLSTPQIVNSSKEVILDIQLEEALKETTTDEVLITAQDFPTRAANPLSVVSTRSFNAEESGRYAASVNDPGRMALSLPGVQQGRDETENDVIIRGNSSFGVLWRLEGIDIPNPNHFARPGTSGGGITVFSAQLLDRSDFSTGGMPAEYGNALAGAYDIHFRKGNTESREYRIKLGLLGMDFATEGPIRPGKSSYLVNYRYSTLSLLNDLGFELVGERVDNDFQDLSFNLAWQSKSKRTFMTLFGIGGLSRERYRPVAVGTERDLGIGNHWEDRDRVSNMGASGFTLRHLIDEKSYLKWVVAGMYGDINYEYDTLSLENVRFRYNTERYQDGRFASSLTYHRKLSVSTQFKAGLHVNQIFFTFFRQAVPRSPLFDITQNDLNQAISIEGAGQTQTVQLYGQVTHKWPFGLTLNAGAHALFLNLNNTWQLDPRLSFSYRPAPKHQFALAYGIHSQMLPLGQYFYTTRDTLPDGEVIQQTPNFDLDMIRSHHLIFAYNFLLTSQVRLGVDIYYQRIFQVPVFDDPTSTWWMLNSQAAISTNPLISAGKGTNYGINFVAEKTFSDGVFVLFTA